MSKLTPARAIAVNMARDYLKLSPDLLPVFLGDDWQRRFDSLAVMVAAYDYAVAVRDSLVALPSPPVPVALIGAPAASVETVDVDAYAPSFELVVQIWRLTVADDIDNLAPEDQIDAYESLDWCQFWYDWYAKKSIA